MFKHMNLNGLTPQLQRAIQRSPITGYRLAKNAGVSESSISRFMRGKGGLSLAAIDRIWHVLDLHIDNSGGQHHGNTHT